MVYEYSYLIMPALFAIIAFILEPLAYIDWWKPLTITKTIPGIESLLFGFFVGKNLNLSGKENEK